MMQPSQAHFGHDDGIDRSQPLEMRGMSSNLAFLFCYADAVVVVDRIKIDIKASSFEVKECLWSSNGIVVGDKITVCEEEGQYFSNSREVVDVKTQADGKGYGIVTSNRRTPSLMFLRKVSSIPENWYKTPTAENAMPDPDMAKLPLYKVVNGGQGAFALPHKLRPPIPNTYDSYSKTSKYILEDLQAGFGTTDSELIMTTVRDFFRSGAEFIEMENAVTAKFKKDAALLVQAQVMDKSAHAEKQEK